MTVRDKERNKQLVERYPFLLPRNRWTDKVSEDYDYSYTELDAMPDGWRDSFGVNMCEELLHCLEKADFVNDYRILQIKEKYGGLRLYDAGFPESIYDEAHAIIHKYVEKSYETCGRCGAPATLEGVGWIFPYCEDCAKAVGGLFNIRGTEDYVQYDRVSTSSGDKEVEEVEEFVSSILSYARDH